MPHLKHGLLNHPTRYLIVKDRVAQATRRRFRRLAGGGKLFVSTVPVKHFFSNPVRRLRPVRVAASRLRRRASTLPRRHRQHFFFNFVSPRSDPSVSGFPLWSSASTLPRPARQRLFSLNPKRRCAPSRVAAFRSGLAYLADAAMPVNPFFQSWPGFLRSPSPPAPVSRSGIGCLRPRGPGVNPFLGTTALFAHTHPLRAALLPFPINYRPSPYEAPLSHSPRRQSRRKPGFPMRAGTTNPDELPRLPAWLAPGTSTQRRAWPQRPRQSTCPSRPGPTTPVSVAKEAWGHLPGGTGKKSSPSPLKQGRISPWPLSSIRSHPPPHRPRGHESSRSCTGPTQSNLPGEAKAAPLPPRNKRALTERVKAVSANLGVASAKPCSPPNAHRQAGGHLALPAPSGAKQYPLCPQPPEKQPSTSGTLPEATLRPQRLARQRTRLFSNYLAWAGFVVDKTAFGF